jgi:Integrase core domain
LASTCSMPSSSSAGSETARLDQRYTASNGGMDCTPADRGIYGVALRRRLEAMGIRDRPIARGSPWQNGFVERLIGSIRRECLDHVIVVGEAHLRRILRSYCRYYNEIRTHRSLDKDAPFRRPIQSVGTIRSRAILGGLHHHSPTMIAGSLSNCIDGFRQS